MWKRVMMAEANEVKVERDDCLSMRARSELPQKATMIDHSGR